MNAKRTGLGSREVRKGAELTPEPTAPGLHEGSLQALADQAAGAASGRPHTSKPSSIGAFCHIFVEYEVRQYATYGRITVGPWERALPGLVHVVVDDAGFRAAIEHRLKKAGYEVATYPSAQHLLDNLPSDIELGCILLDVRIPGLSRPELQERLSEVGSTLPVISFLSGHSDIPITVQAIKAGAVDFLFKPISSVLLLQAIERALGHHEVARRLNSKLDLVRAHIGKLTPRERQVFELVVRGQTNKQVGNSLGSTERTEYRMMKSNRRRKETA